MKVQTVRKRFSILDLETPEQLTEKLMNHTWCLCNGFRLGGYVFLNDSFSEDGAGEWAVIRESDKVQVESITFSWCKPPEALALIQRVLAGEFDGMNCFLVPGLAVRSCDLQSPKEHGRCRYCE